MHLISTGDSQQSPATTHQCIQSSCVESLQVKLYAFLATRQTLRVFKPEGSVAHCGLVLHPKIKVQGLLECALQMHNWKRPEWESLNWSRTS